MRSGYTGPALEQWDSRHAAPRCRASLPQDIPQELKTLANHKSALKRARQSTERRLRNRHYRTVMRNHVKALRAAIDAADADAAKALLPTTVSMIQKVAQKGVIHKRNAARRVSRLTLAVNAIGE